VSVAPLTADFFPGQVDTNATNPLNFTAAQAIQLYHEDCSEAFVLANLSDVQSKIIGVVLSGDYIISYPESYTEGHEEYEDTGPLVRDNKFYYTITSMGENPLTVSGEVDLGELYAQRYK
jgi:hypothetical protein